MSAIARLKEAWFDINALMKASAIMGWDQQVVMPPAGAKARGAQQAILARLMHERITGDEFRKLVGEAESEAEPGSDDAAVVRAVQREIDVRVALPKELVERKSRVSSDAYLVWRKARVENDFAALAPYLEELFDIARETAERRGFADHPYDALIDLFEEGATYRQAFDMFEALKGPIRDLIDAQAEFGNGDDRYLIGEWDQERLRSWAQATCGKVGFDFHRGRLDLCSNAFCSNFSTDDVRMTTRGKDHLNGVIFSSLHEMGHGLYEQGSPREWDRTPICGGISLGVHESQSRLWENIVGRSMPFWNHFMPSLSEAMGIDPDAHRFYRAINRVEPGPIRIGSDELSYNLHILVRFELECEVVTRKTAVKDLPEAWRDKMNRYLGVKIENDADGVLQDVHWSRGSIGYFPTYSMGNLISWQVWFALQEELGDVDSAMAAGDFSGILGWLTEKIYAQGKRYRPSELVERVTGGPMRPEAYILGMRKKYPL